MAFPFCFTYHIRHHSCLNPQAGSSSHAMLLLRHHQSFGGDLNQIKKRAESPKYLRSVCLPSRLQDCQVTSSHFTSLRRVTVLLALLFYIFLLTSIPLPSIYLRQMQQILHQKLLQSCTIYCKCQELPFLFFCLFYKYLTLHYTKPSGLESWGCVSFCLHNLFSTATAPYPAGRNAIEVSLTSKEAEVKEPSTESCVSSQVCYAS